MQQLRHQEPDRTVPFDYEVYIPLDFPLSLEDGGLVTLIYLSPHIT